jgi:hypothetical protein
MPNHGPTTRAVSPLRELRLAPWRAPESGPVLLGSLSAVLRDFTVQRPMPVIPGQRTPSEPSRRFG